MLSSNLQDTLTTSIMKFAAVVVILATSCQALSPRQRFAELKQGRPFLESYWESYLSQPFDYNNCFGHDNPTNVDETAYGYDFATVPVDKVKVVNIAFAKPDERDCHIGAAWCQPVVCGLHLFGIDGIDDERINKLKSDIKTLRNNGAIVKLAYGGEEWGNTVIQTKVTFIAEALVNYMVKAVNVLGVDGIDLTQNEGVGTTNFIASDQTSMQLYIVNELRKRLPDSIISYTFPGDELGFPFRDVVQYGHQYFDSITAYRATPATMDGFQSLGVPPNKLVWGIAIGCNGIFDDVPVTDAVNVAQISVTRGYAGVMTWSINRDTDHRHGNNGECNTLQTGQPDGTYIDAIYNALMS